MKTRKVWIIGVLIAVFSIGMIADADAHRRGYRRGYGNHYRPHRVWVAPPPVVVVAPGYGYRARPYYARPYRGYHGYRQGCGYSYNGRGRGYGYGYRRW